MMDILNKGDPFIPSKSKGETETPQSKENIIPNERAAFLLFPFFIDLIDQFKSILKNLKFFTRIVEEKIGDKKLGAFFNRIIAEDIKKIELVQNSLLHYIQINNPIIRTNTVNTLIEEELKKYQVHLEEKNVKLLKTLEEGLPETSVPDDQLRYIVSSVLQYVMALTHSNGYFGLYTRSGPPQKETGEDQISDKRERKYIEILMIFTSPKKQMAEGEPALEMPTRQKDGILELALRLVDEIIQKNHGLMKFEVDEKMAKTTISLRFPIERRKVVYYQPATELSSNVHRFKSTFEKLSSLEEMKKRND
jgi:hypothetical protein